MYAGRQRLGIEVTFGEIVENYAGDGWGGVGALVLSHLSVLNAGRRPLNQWLPGRRPALSTENWKFGPAAYKLNPSNSGPKATVHAAMSRTPMIFSHTPAFTIWAIVM